MEATVKHTADETYRRQEGERNPLLTGALDYASRNIPVFPLKPKAKEPAIPSAHPEGDPLRGTCHGKCGRLGHGFWDATTDTSQIRKWWEQWPDANIGLACGDHLTVVDIDSAEGVEALQAIGFEANGAPVVRTGKGHHYWFRADGAGCHTRFLEGVDLKSNGGYVIAPPSIHPDGPVYTWVRPLDGELPVLPQVILDAVKRHGRLSSRRESEPVGELIPKGRQNNTLTSLAGSMRHRGMTVEEIAASLLVTNDNRCEEPLSEHEVRQIAWSVGRYEPSKNGSAPVEQDGPAVPDPVRFQDAKAVPLEWLWDDYVPRGMLSIVQGNPGLGKSVAMLDLAARVTAGKPMPDGSTGVSGAVVLVAPEDDLAKVVVPRFKAAGGNVDRAVELSLVKLAGEAEDIAFPTHAAVLEEQIRAGSAVLVVIDDFDEVVEDGYSLNNGKHMAKVMRSLREVAESTNAAIVLIRHINKASGTNSVQRGSGSIKIPGKARVVLDIGKHPENDQQRVLTVGKANLTKDTDRSLAFEMQDTPIKHKGVAYHVPVLNWLGKVDVSSADLLAASDEEKHGTQAVERCGWLRELLEAGPRTNQEVMREAKDAGYRVTERTLRRDLIRIGGSTSGTQGIGAPSTWSLSNQEGVLPNSQVSLGRTLSSSLEELSDQAAGVAAEEQSQSHEEGHEEDSDDDALFTRAELEKYNLPDLVEVAHEHSVTIPSEYHEDKQWLISKILVPNGGDE